MASIVPGMKKAPSRSADQFVVRLPDGMRDRISDAAEANNRSMNAEIVARLQQSLDPSPLSPLVPPMVADAMAEIREYASEVGVTPDEALHAMLLAARSPSAAPVCYFVVDRNMTIGQMKDMFALASERLPADATIHQHSRDVTAPDLVPFKPTPYSERAKRIVEGELPQKPKAPILPRKRKPG